MKLPKLFGKKKTDDVDDFEDDELDAIEAAEESEDSEDDDLDDENGDDLDNDKVVQGTSRKSLFLAIGIVSAVVIAGVAGGAWWLMGGSHPPGSAARAPRDPNVIVLDIPPRPGEARAAAATDTLNAIAATTDRPDAGVVVRPVEKVAFAGMAIPQDRKPLAAAPDSTLVEQGVRGPLPKIAADGRKPWQAYARPYPATDKRPRVAIIVGGLGMSREATEGAIRFLPNAVTLAFDPYGRDLTDWAAMARHAGHEILASLPMESAGFPARDPGRYALSTAGSQTDNEQRMDFLLSRFAGYVGVMTAMGSQFTLDETQMKPVMEVIKKRGLLYVDAMTTHNTVGPAMAQGMGVPRGYIDLQIDDNPSKAAIGKRLSELEDLARRHGSAIAIARPLPVTVERLVAWAASLEGRDVALAPVSAAIDRQPLR